MKSCIDLFKVLEEKNLYTLRGDCVIVEKLPEPEITTASGIKLIDHSTSLDGYKADKVPVVRVLQVGEGEVDEETGEIIPLDFKVGDLLWIGPLATVRWVSDFFGLISNTADRKVGIMQGYDANAFIKIDSEEKYKEVYKVVKEFV